ncbi:hypothetical protein Tco_0846883, partial [Tanacetum coccineum]
NTFKAIAAKWGVLLDIDDSEELDFHTKSISYLHKNSGPHVRAIIYQCSRTGDSILNLLKQVCEGCTKTRGYNKDGDVVKDIEEIIESQGDLVVNSMNLNAVGNPGGFYDIWDPNAFRKSSSTVSDCYYFLSFDGKGRNLRNGEIPYGLVILRGADLWKVLKNGNGGAIVLVGFNIQELKNLQDKGINMFDSIASNLEWKPRRGVEDIAITMRWVDISQNIP